MDIMRTQPILLFTILGDLKLVPTDLETHAYGSRTVAPSARAPHLESCTPWLNSDWEILPNVPTTYVSPVTECLSIPSAAATPPTLYGNGCGLDQLL